MTVASPFDLARLCINLSPCLLGLVSQASWLRAAISTWECGEHPLLLSVFDIRDSVFLTGRSEPSFMFAYIAIIITKIGRSQALETGSILSGLILFIEPLVS